jgi:hypothetical protein
MYMSVQKADTLSAWRREDECCVARMSLGEVLCNSMHHTLHAMLAGGASNSRMCELEDLRVFLHS